MIVVDTSALISILFREPGHEVLEARLVSEEKILLTAANWFESAMVASRLGPRGKVLLDEFFAMIRIVIIPIDQELAEIALGAFIKFGRGRHSAALNFGDCFSYALAKQRNLPLLYVGQDFSKTDVKTS